MKTRTIATLLAVLLGASVNFAQNTHVASPSAITGVWRADLNGMPVVTLVVSDEGGPLSGAVLFYFQTRKNVNSPWIATAGLPEPMLQPSFDGTTLRFQVSHRRAHPPRTLNDPPMPFHLKLTGPDKAELLNEREGGPLMVTRSDY